MIDLSGIARHLRLNVDQIRVAADLLEQGYSPTFIARYRGDEIGQLPRTALRRLKYELDRRQRIEAARERAIRHLPKDAALDQEAEKSLLHAHTSAAMESALKCFRARRVLEHSQERDGAAGKLLEAMVTCSGVSIDNPSEWAAQQLSVDATGGQAALTQVARLIAALIQGDTALNERLRQTIHRRATLRVGQYVAPVASSGELTSCATATDLAPEVSETAAHIDDDHDINDVHSGDTLEGEALDEAGFEHDDHDTPPDGSESGHSENQSLAAKDDASTLPAAAGNRNKSGSAKPLSKLTPRQRRRRWLAAMLTPLRSLNKPLNKLSHYQFLMLSRGVRSQLVSLNLEYDPNLLVDLARNSFTDAKHPWAAWIGGVIAQALDNGMRSKLEADVLAECEEVANESLLEHAADELRSHLLRRPVRGHTIALLDTVGPKTVVVVFVSPSGDVLACEEIACGVQPEIISQNVVKLGELIHQHRATLVALTNGPARRFVVLTLRELMQQSKDSGLRWTMADRSGAEAYAGSRIGLRELSTYNRRQRAAIWAARCLQDPLVELLKADSGRLRLGSYQRELPQEPLKKLVQETIIDCVCARGVDARNASERELQFVPGVGPAQAKQIVNLSASGQLTNRQQLQSLVTDWSEVDMRQSLGWLRVFGSDCILDATLVHPEEYHLAQRLLSNTPLNQPASAPEGWTARASSAGSPSTGQSSSLESQDSDPIATDQNEADSGANVEAVDQAAPNISQSAESDAETSQTSGAQANEFGINDQAVDFNQSDNQEAATSQAATLQPQAAQPEYPEQIQDVPKVELPFDAEKLANGWQVGRAKLKRIAGDLLDPFGDPRLLGTPVPLLGQMPTLESLQPGTCLWAVVIGVAEFGAFVELAPNCTGMIHISRLSENYVEDPHQCVQVGDLLLTWVIRVDDKKNRVALTCLSPELTAKIEAEAQQRKSREDSERSQQGGRGSAGGRFERREGQSQGQSNSSRGQASGRGQARSESTSRAEQAPGQRRQASGRTPQSDQRGRRPDGRGRGDQRGRGEQRGQRSSKSIEYTSKKPVAPISQAMKQGEEPLRSFSDLFQFYEAQRTGQPAETPTKTKATALEPATSDRQQSELDASAQQSNIQPAVQVADATPDAASDADAGNTATNSSQ